MKATSKQRTLGKVRRPIVFRYRPPPHQHMFDPDTELYGKVRCLECHEVIELAPLIVEDVRDRRQKGNLILTRKQWLQYLKDTFK